MRIGGFEPFTLSDYPGMPAAVVFTQGCNMACPFCHNSELIDCQRPGAIDKQEVFRVLRRRGRVLRGVVVSGGEPTVQPDLPEFCEEVHAMGFAVKLDTNGSRPDVLRGLLERGLVDYVAMDIKAPLHDAERHWLLTGSRVSPERMLKSMQLIASSGVRHHFRTTVVSQWLREEDILAIEHAIPHGSQHVRQTFRSELAWDERLSVGELAASNL
jgi:pyruvate formate lyase activating enzyme